MNRGYTLFWRKTWDNPVLKERGKRFSRLEAWLYLVNFQARGTDDPESGLKRGEFEVSYRFLTKAWNWGRGSVERFMNNLASNSMIMRVGHQVGQETGHFIICNYDTYNPTRDTKWDTKWDKVKEGLKEGINKKQTSQAAGAAAVDPLPSTESVRLSEFLRRCIQVRDENAKSARLPVPIRWAHDIDKLIRIDGRRIEDVEAVIAWCQKDGCFWAPNILSGRKLREKFDTMYGQMQREKNGSKPKGEIDWEKHGFEKNDDSWLL